MGRVELIKEGKMKCGYFSKVECYSHVRYDCSWFGFSANDEDVLCEGCYFDDDYVPHIDEYEVEGDD